MNDRVFELTEDHIRLLRSAYVWWDGCEYGAPAINCKRPYGNSDVEGDIFAILDIEPEFVDRDGLKHWSQDQHDAAFVLHKQTETALQIVLCTGSFVPGVYVMRKRSDGRSWALQENR